MLLNCECRYLTFDDLWARVIRPSERAQKRRRWWKLPLLWIDPLRGYVVGGFLFEAFRPERGASGLERMSILALSGALLLLTLWAQSLGRKGVRETVSPAGFLAGILVAILPLTVSIPVLVLGAAAASASKSYAVGYFAAVVATLGFGFVFMGKSPMLGIVVCITGFPLLINWLRRSQLVTPVRC
jgi:hypothetical protein